MDEKIEKEESEKSETDRRDFLKTAVKMAGALAAVSAIGNLVEDSEAQVKTLEKAAVATPLASQKIAGAEVNFLKAANKKQFGLKGAELGKILQSEGFIPGNIRDLGKASLHVSVSW